MYSSASSYPDHVDNRNRLGIFFVFFFLITFIYTGKTISYITGFRSYSSF